MKRKFSPLVFKTPICIDVKASKRETANGTDKEASSGLTHRSLGWASRQLSVADRQGEGQ